MKVTGPKFITAELEQRIRLRLVAMRQEGQAASKHKLLAIAERCYAEEHALSWVLEEANCARNADRPHGIKAVRA